MANDFYTADQVSQVALRLVEEDQYLSALVSRDIVDPLKGGGAGRTISLAIPNALVARDRDIDDKETELVYDELAEARITTTAGSAAYSGVSLSDGDLSLDLSDFSRQVLAKQVDAVVEKIENAVATSLLSIPLNTDVAWDSAHPERTFTQIRKILRKRGVPQTGIRCVVGVDVYAALLDADLLVDASSSGSTAALREGNIGRIRGFDIVESTRVSDGDIAVFHKDALSFSVRAPLAAAGQFAATATGNGYSLRYTRGFDMSNAETKSLLDTMYAIVKLPMYKITRDESTHKATATQLAAGEDATFRMSISDAEPAADDGGEV